MKTFIRMIYLGIGTLIIGIVVNQFIANGIRLSILFNSIPLVSAKKIDYLSADDALKLLNEKQAAFVDVRSGDEFDMDHIEGAISLPVVKFISNPVLLNNYDKDKNVTAVLYSGKKIDDNIELAARSLLKIGIKQVKILDGGFEEWLKKEYPVEF